MSPASLGVVLCSVAMVMTGQLLLKRGMSKLGPLGADLLAKPWDLVGALARRWHVVVGLGTYGAASLLWIYALSRVPLSLAYPFLGFSYAGVPLAAAALLGERPTPAQWFGTALVVAGVVVVVVSA